MKGLKEYTKSGYLNASKHFNSADLDVDCTGKGYMITGANSGIGKVTALEIAKRGGTIHMVCRSKERGEEAKQAIVEQSRNENVHLHLLDMSKPRDVAKFARDFTEAGHTLNVLINNAGCMVGERELQEDGLEKNFATNTLGTYILTHRLLPIMIEKGNARVITVTSGGMLVNKLDAKDLNFEKVKTFDGTFAYAQNKRQQVVMTEDLAKRWKQVHFSTMHPGWADTPAVRTSMPSFYERMKNKLRTAEQGADTLVWLAVSEAANKHDSGLFFQDRTPVSTHLRFASTKSTAAEEQLLMDRLGELADKFSQPALALPESSPQSSTSPPGHVKL